MSKASEVVNLALSEVGYVEKAGNADLDDKTGNTGSSNYTKYARDLAEAGYYNGSKNGYAWCDVFVDWLFFKLYGKAEGQRIQCQTGDLGAACIYSAGYYKAQNRFDSNPRVGDQVFFYVDGQINHTGLVVEVDDEFITTVEGNSSDMVKQNHYSRSNGRIAGYGHPFYDDTAVADASPAAMPEITVKLHELSRGCSGGEVKSVQILLNAAGLACELTADGCFGAETESAVIAAQKMFFPNESSEWDGIVGKNTWTAMLTELK